MAWVVDTCMLIDVAEGDPQFGRRSARLLDNRRVAGLVVAPVSFVELSPLFNGVVTVQNEFLEAIGVHWTHTWTWPDTIVAHRAWHEYMQKRGGQLSKTIAVLVPLSRFDGLLTRNASDFRVLFPDLRTETP